MPAPMRRTLTLTEDYVTGPLRLSLTRTRA
jgi:hypothetical protein